MKPLKQEGYEFNGDWLHSFLWSQFDHFAEAFDKQSRKTYKPFGTEKFFFSFLQAMLESSPCYRVCVMATTTKFLLEIF